MAKQGMKRFDRQHPQEHAATVPEIQGKAKSGKEKVRPMIAGVPGADGKVYHYKPHKPTMLSVIENELAVDNMEDHWDMTAADRQDFKE